MLATGSLRTAQGRGGGDYTLRRSQVKRNSCACFRVIGVRPACYWRGVSRALVAVSGALWLVWAGAAPVRAYEDQASFDAELSYGHAVSEVTPPNGVALGLGASLGLSDVFSVRGQLTWALHPGEPQMTSLVFVSAELLYLIDVLEIVPYFGLGLDGVGSFASGRDFGCDLGLHPVLGLDWLLSREVALGVTFRPVFFVTALETDPVYFKAGATFSYLFDL
jgi:hypothetical protein